VILIALSRRGKSNNTDIYETFCAMGDALREHFSARGATPLCVVVVGRGGPNLVRGMGVLAETLDSLGLRGVRYYLGIDSLADIATACDRICVL
jgi:hypothetical protein